MSAPPLYSARDAARILDLNESRVQYWARTGIVAPSVRRGSKLLFTFADLIAVKAAKQLIERGVSLQAVRKTLAALRSALPEVDRPLSQLRLISDGDRLIVAGADAPFEPLTGQVVLDFTVAQLGREAQLVSPLPRRDAAPEPAPPEDEPRTPYAWFLRGTALDDAGETAAAEHAYRRALTLDPALAAAHTNLGDLCYRAGRTDEARRSFEQALALDPDQPEARFNLGNLYDQAGEPELATAEWSRVCDGAPDFADAHFNLGAALAGHGDAPRARHHLARYLELEASGELSGEARRMLGALP